MRAINFFSLKTWFSFILRKINQTSFLLRCLYWSTSINYMVNKQQWFIFIYFYFILFLSTYRYCFFSLLSLVFFKLENYEPFNSIPFILNFEPIYLWLPFTPNAHVVFYSIRRFHSCSLGRMSHKARSAVILSLDQITLY